MDIIKRIQELSDEKSHSVNFNIIENIKDRIQGIFNSEVYRQSRSPEMRRLFPQIIENENLRIRVDLPKVKE